MTFSNIKYEFVLPIYDGNITYFRRCDPTNPSTKPWVMVYANSYISVIDPDGVVYRCGIDHSNPFGNYGFDDCLTWRGCIIHLIDAEYQCEWLDAVKETLAKL